MPFGLFVVLCLVAGCGDDDSPLDTTGPTITSLTAALAKDPDNNDPSRTDIAEPGDTITITLVANEAILLPALRMATVSTKNGEQEFTAQSDFPRISGGGTNWTYSYRIVENFGFNAATSPGQIVFFPFRPRDIAGNLGPQVDGFTDGTTSLMFIPDTDPPGLANNIEVQLQRSAAPDANNNLTYSISLTADEQIREPSGRLGSSQFTFIRSADSKTWTGVATRRASAPFNVLTVSIRDLGGNLSQFFTDQIVPDQIVADRAISQALEVGIPPFVILGQNGFDNRNFPLVITTADASFTGDKETLGEMESDVVHWSLGDDGVLTLDWHANTQDIALFTTQFFDVASADRITDIAGGKQFPNLSDYHDGQMVFDIMVTSGDDGAAGYGNYESLLVKIDHVVGSTNFCNCDQNLGTPGDGGWETVRLPIRLLRESRGALNLTMTKTGIVIWPDFDTQDSGTNQRLVMMLRNIRLEAQVSETPTGL